MPNLTRILLSSTTASGIAGKSYYLTTPIFYVNSVPHIGHLYTALLADAQARWKRLQHGGQSVHFATGTDEHGIKIQKKAALEKKDCLKFCDGISAKFKTLFDQCDISYNDFIRTTEARHRKAVEHFWNNLIRNDYIYKSSYEGWYSVNDECFLNDDQTEVRTDSKGNQQRFSLESGHQVEYASETNYVFKLSQFKDQLRNYLSQNIIMPKNYAEMLHTQLETLQDLSVSRESNRIHWGIQVPNDPSQIIYVWLDALVNYLTVAGYPDETAKFEKLWPADVHIVGKDILRFHALYWPAFLMASNISLPKRILCHGHWLVDNKKMSKSIGNVIDPFDCIKKYTKDGLRYFLLREGVPDSDCNISAQKFTKFTNAELSNTLGNLYQRSLPFNRELSYPSYSQVEADLTKDDKDFLDKLDELRDDCGKDFDSFNFYLGIPKIMAQLRTANTIFQEYKPWLLAKSSNEAEKKAITKLLFIIYESLRISGLMLQPVVPPLANDLLDRLNVSKEQRGITNALVDRNRSDSGKLARVANEVLFKRM